MWGSYFPSPWAPAGRGKRASLEILKSFVRQKSPIYCRWKSWNTHAVELQCCILKKTPRMCQNSSFSKAKSPNFLGRRNGRSQDPISGGEGTTLSKHIHILVTCGQSCHLPLPLMENILWAPMYISTPFNGETAVSTVAMEAEKVEENGKMKKRCLVVVELKVGNRE